MKKNRLLVIILFVVMLVPGAGPFNHAVAFDSETPFTSISSHDHWQSDGMIQQSPEGDWFKTGVSGLTDEAVEFTLQGAGGPDDFGYVWDGNVTTAWVNAVNGTDTGINDTTDYVGPVDIGFSFKYYENTYNQLYISRYGFVSFNDDGISNSQSQIPSMEKPDDVIAPHWVPAYSVNGYVRYMSGGIAPDRWFVVEWNQLKSDCGGDVPEIYTFEVILHENGDILFQYAEMIADGYFFCQSSGIEDSIGMDGLSVTAYCMQIAPYHAVLIERPGASARVSAYPQYNSCFTALGDENPFQITIRNTGDFGDDTYDIFPCSTWPLDLYAADGVTPLVDTDSDGNVDTGPVAQGGSADVVAKVNTPVTADAGDYNAAEITIQSSNNTDRSKTVEVQTAVPAPFAQVFRDNANNAMSIYLAEPASQVLTKATTDWRFGSNPAVAEMTDGFAYFWTKYRHNGSVTVNEIEYTLLDGNGVIRLADHSSANMITYDCDVVVAVTPDGHIGVLWYRHIYDESISSWNSNIYYAVLHASGNVVVAPTNLTNSTLWSCTPYFHDPRIEATTDNRFVSAWHKNTGGSLDDIYFAVLDTGGNEIKTVTLFTSDSPGLDSGNIFPGLARLNGNRALLAWQQYIDGDTYDGYNIRYAVINSDGSTFADTVSLPAGSGRCFGLDAVQLSDGNIVIAWTAWDDSTYRIHYVVLNSGYELTAGPIILSNSVAVSGDDYVSLAADNAGHAIFTWVDYWWDSQRNIYYALIDGSGEQVTPPMTFITTESADTFIHTSREGYGNTSYTIDRCKGDFDLDRDVDGSDLAVFAADFGRTDCSAENPCSGDFDNNSNVDETDLAVFSAYFGRTDCP